LKPLNEEPLLRDVMQVSMERVAKHADISKSLIYKYFDSIGEILHKLLQRELAHLRHTQFEAAEAANTFEEMVQGITRTYLHNISKKGLLIERLQADPAISRTKDPTAFDREVAVESYNEGLAKLSDNLRILTLPETGHWPHVERTDEVTTAILQLLGETVRPTDRP
ncbi:MAG: TetR/AcrR family transcriptional regulator, partial [Pseudomonadota bacterium]